MINKISKTLASRNIWHKIKNDFIVTKKSTVKIPKLNKDLAYLSGVIVGDGTILKIRRKKGGFHYKIKITSDSKNYLNTLNKIFEDNFNINGYIEKDKRKVHTYYLTLQNATIFWFFVLLGHEIGKKKGPIIPSYFLNNKILLIHFLAGLVDTDGHISYNRIQLKQKSRIFLSNICLQLKKINMNPNYPKVNYTNQKPFYYIRFDNKLSLRTPQ